MDKDPVLMAEDFEDPLFAQNNSALFDEFIDLCIKGVEELSAMRIVFGESTVQDGGFIGRLYALKRNPYYKKRFPLALAAMKTDEIWNPRIAMTLLVSIARSSTKDSARINAIRELNVMTGITIIDEAGNTKMGRNLDDFYTKVQEKIDSHYPPAPTETKH